MAKKTFFLLLLFFTSATIYAQHYRVKNKLNPTHFLNTEQEGDVLSSTIKEGWWSAQWRLEPLAGNDNLYFRIVNKWRECALDVENGHLVCKPLDENRQTQIWTIIMEGSETYTAILNVGNRGYLHENNGKLSFYDDVYNDGAYWLFKNIDEVNSTPSTHTIEPEVADNKEIIAGIQTLSQAQKNEFVDLHNKARAEVGVGKVKWSEEVAAYAAQWANHLANEQNCKLDHRPNNRYGENIFGGSAIFNKPSEIVGAWLEEKNLYKGGVMDDINFEAGHYTQVIWGKTTEIGCAVVACANGNIIAVCNYNPAGNMFGESPLSK